jgi:hypothetical protein
MADGSLKEIEKIKIGDRVMTFDGGSDRVKRVYRRESDHAREIWYRSATGEHRRIETTDDHLLWVDGKQWVPARLVKIGDSLLGPDKDRWEVVRNERFERPAQVFNFDVTKYRSYFAGGILAHERCGRPAPGVLTKLQPKTMPTVSSD